MTRGTFRVLTALLVLGVVLLAAGRPALAQPAECGVEREVPGRALDETTYRQLNVVYQAVGEENYDEAYRDLERMFKRAGKDEYLTAVLSQAMAQVEWARGNFDRALAHFEKAVAVDVLPNQVHFALMYQIAQLYYLQERYREALDKLELWFCTAPRDKVTAAAHVLEASIHASMQNFPETLKAIETAIAMEAEPKEQWYQLKLAAHYELEQFPQVADTLETMVVHWPEKKSYWLQLAQSYFKLKQDDRALAALALAYRKGLLDSGNDLVYLASLYMNSEVPYKAAQVLEKGIADGIIDPNQKNWTLTADAWYSAEELEKALAAYQEAGRAATDGDIDLRRGYILVDLERWPEALEALDAAISKGGLNDRKLGEAYLLRGMAQFNLENFDDASADWGRASRYERTRDAAQQWMAHLREERRKRAP